MSISFRRQRWGFRSSSSDVSDNYPCMVSVRAQRGHMVDLYDGRKWPVVQCGSVYVSDGDTAQQVTNSIIKGNSLTGKKKHANKYTVAIGTTHGHVQAFLEDADVVLAAFDSCHAEEKCLMLIKRPKSSTRQMLKAHSWANLSVSDTQLYAPLDGTGNSLTRPDYRKNKFKWKKKEDGKSRMSSSSLTGGSTQSLFTSDRSNAWREDLNSRMFVPISAVKGFSRSVSHQEINNNYTDVHGKLKRFGPRYPGPAPPVAGAVQGVPQGPQSPVYHSRMELPTLPVVSESDDDEGRIGNDQLYSPANSEPPNGDKVSRAQSLGDLSTGLTLSIVGQRKADSMLNISSGQPTPSKRYHKNSKIRSPQSSVYSSRNLLKESVQEEVPERLHESERGYVSENRPSYGGHIRENGYGRVSESRHVSENGRISENGHVQENDRASQASRGSDQGRSSASSVSSRDKVTGKVKRSLPHVPVNEASERIKRFTELMKARMALHSSASQSTASAGSVTPQQNGHAIPVITQTDSEIVTSPLESPPYKGNTSRLRERDYHAVKKHHLSDSERFRDESLPGHQVTLQGTPLHVADRSADSGQTTLTSHSHSSTMDSGYTTNNDCDSEIYSAVPRHLGRKGGYSISETGFVSQDSSYVDALPRRNGRRHHSLVNSVSDRVDVRRLSPQHGFCPVSEGEELKSQHRPLNHHDPPTLVREQKVANHYGSQPNLNTNHTSNGRYIPQNQRPYGHQDLPESYTSSSRVVLKPNAQNHSKDYGVEYKTKEWDHRDVNSGGDQSPHDSMGFRSVSQSSYADVRQRLQGHGDNDSIPEQRPDSQSSLDSIYCSTLPGNWKFNGKDDIGNKGRLSKIPTLYQLSQIYNFHGAKVMLPANRSVDESLNLVDKMVELPTLREGSPKDSTLSSTPQGRYARLGGPGSAFRPVKAATSTTFPLVTIKRFEEDIICVPGSLCEGDLLIEMNGRLILGADSKLVQKTLEIIQGEVILTVGRAKSTTETSSAVTMEQMVQEIDFLRAQIAQRDTHIKHMQATSPWQQDSSPNVVVLRKEFPNEEVEISDDEFIV